VYYPQISEAMVVLEKDICDSGAFITELHNITYEIIRRRTKKIFADLVSEKTIDLIPTTKDKLEDGLKFVLLPHALETGDLKQSSRSIEELSGGQKSLLSLSFIFACALNRPSPLYLFDEIDAALDESNQHTIASIISMIFKDKTIFCVSHHPDFQTHAMSFLTARMVDGKTVITTPKEK
jgi:chromosome segregation ATPase